MAEYIQKNAAAAAGAPLFPIIVFTAENIAALDVKESRIPAVHASKLSGALRQQSINLKPLPKEQYDALRAAFDDAAGHLLEATVEESGE